MSSTDLYLVAAGNGSRISGGLPKALVKILDEPCLTTTLRTIGHKFNMVFIVTNNLMQEQWLAYFQDLRTSYPDLASSVINLPIESGFGDGHATLQGLLKAEERETLPSTEVVIAWGDVFFPTAKIVDELLSIRLKGVGVVPAMLEANPYVSLLVDGNMRCISAEFSKYGERHPAGLHDQSVFRFDRYRLRRCLRDLHNALWKGRRYIAPGGELSLLYTLHEFYNSGDPVYVYETCHRTLAFNTTEEVDEIELEVRSCSEQELKNES